MLECANKADASTHSASEQPVDGELPKVTHELLADFEIVASDRIGTGVNDVTIVETGVASPARHST